MKSVPINGNSFPGRDGKLPRRGRAPSHIFEMGAGVCGECALKGHASERIPGSLDSGSGSAVSGLRMFRIYIGALAGFELGELLHPSRQRVPTARGPDMESLAWHPMDKKKPEPKCRLRVDSPDAKVEVARRVETKAIRRPKETAFTLFKKKFLIVLFYLIISPDFYYLIIFTCFRLPV
ncbi:uncharacterized protein B0H64DRAFT_395677 [Chaetomium fimeti]|uniref:Uncharacterized protein n=1 Tax=Chaetomium fimeti TaxID=1854472 RepID=A0AAE0LS79_9PEZI|nr:hypothetical protein B0H64DRAFT_395677 [Chaetomium fimeti]